MLGQPFLKWHTVACTWAVLHSGKRLVPSLGSSTRFSTNTNGVSRRKKKKTPFNPSRAQQEIAELCGTNNVVVSARPGSGKTATAEAIVAAYPNKRVVVITYSKRLQLETHRRLRTYPNCQVFTFHAMASLLFVTLVHDDATLVKERKRALDRREPPKWSLEPFDIIVLDEFQDCTELLFWLTNSFILANKQKAGGQSARLVVLGDERQSIYRFRGADDRYLSLAPELLGPINPYPFVRAQLDQSFRLSCQSVRFINNTFLGGEPYITSSKPGPKPIVIRCQQWDCYRLAKQLLPLIKRYGAKNTAILAPAVRKRGPLQRVVNCLSEKYGVPIYVSIEEEVSLDDRVMEGKMCVSTIHQFKGSERDLVIVFGIDSSFFGFFGRDLPDDRCPNEIFVALTRADQQLVLVHYEEKELMPFASAEALYETADIVNISINTNRIEPPQPPGRPLVHGLMVPLSIAVRDMVRHVKDEHLCAIVDSHLSIQASPPLPMAEHIKLPNVVISDRGKSFHEAVSDLNGLAVVAACEYEIAKSLKTLNLNQYDIDTMPAIWSQDGVSWLCRKACSYEALVSGYFPRVIKMENHAFDWIEPDDLALAQSRLHGELGESAENPKFEVYSKRRLKIDGHKCRVHGQADIVVTMPSSDGNNAKGGKTVWEIKFVSKLSNQHVIQAYTYAYLLRIPRIILFNVRNGQKWEITPRDGQKGLRRMIEQVIKLKHTSTGRVNDEDFIEACVEARWEALSVRSSIDSGSKMH